MALLTLVRHGQTDWNLHRRIQGRTDIPLNATGRQQAREAADMLRGRGHELVLSSTLARAAETARIIASALKLDSPAAFPELVERDYGEAEGLTIEEYSRQIAVGPIPGVESSESLRERVLGRLNAIDHLAGPTSAVIIVAHGAIIRELIALATEEDRPRPGEVIPNGSWHDFVLGADGITLHATQLDLVG